ncbi:hypothetical protein DL95DRAFT_418269 [Leptodontidium sp. 2 PMI_412]|nr:hypothetical protein DL95DRAFT_418269 [Leptodontidium sp. 2 PMI_412]
MMRQVYATAADVLLWLGVATLDSDIAMDYIAQQINVPWEANDQEIFGAIKDKFKDHQRWTDPEGLAFLRLCQNRYWSRIWIVQEIMNARHITMFFGSKCVDWGCMNSIFRSLNSIRMLGKFALYPYGQEVLGSAAAVITKEKNAWDHRAESEKDGICLSTLIERYHHMECTNPLDKVYGLLGLSSDADQLVVNYEKAPELLYNEVLELVCKTQLVAEHQRENFEKLLLRMFGLVEGHHSLVTVEDITQRQAGKSQILKKHRERRHREVPFYSYTPLDEALDPPLPRSMPLVDPPSYTLPRHEPVSPLYEHASAQYVVSPQYEPVAYSVGSSSTPSGSAGPGYDYALEPSSKLRVAGKVIPKGNHQTGMNSRDLICFCNDHPQNTLPSKRDLPHLPSSLLIHEQDTIFARVNDRLSQLVIKKSSAKKPRLRPLKDDRSILQLISVGIQLSRLLGEAEVMADLDILYVSTERKIRERAALVES